MTDAPPYHPSFATRALELGREGLSRAEIASDLGLTLAQVEALGSQEPAFADALERAEDEARAWWDAAPRKALETSKPFKTALWRKVMLQRFGSGASRQSHAPETTVVPAEPAIHFDFPDNGRDKDAER